MTGQHTLLHTHSVTWPAQSIGQVSEALQPPQGIGKEGERLGHAEFAELLHAAGADHQYASAGWVGNHYRWVVWKLACYERQFPNHLAGRMLTAPVILDQLKYRCVFARLGCSLPYLAYH